MSAARAHVFVTGQVQGVWFRESTRRRAQELGVGGWVRNLPDGRVEAVFEGDEEAVRRAVDFVREGPTHARVEQVTVEQVTVEQVAGEHEASENPGNHFRVR